MKRDPKARFSSRVDDYVKYRPTYPVEILDLLADACGLTPDSVIADIGSGTGILSRMFLENGNAVIGVEPNREMREASEKWLEEYARFTTLDGSAEATRLPAHSMDFMLAAQAFHWFDRDKARAEWQRVLKPEGWAVLIWNERLVGSSPFLVEYEAALQEFGTDYKEVNHTSVKEEQIRPFFSDEFHTARFDNFQPLDFDGLIGRSASASYCPERGSERFDAMSQRLKEIFARHARNGKVVFEYNALVYYGNMD